MPRRHPTYQKEANSWYCWSPGARVVDWYDASLAMKRKVFEKVAHALNLTPSPQSRLQSNPMRRRIPLRLHNLNRPRTKIPLPNEMSNKLHRPLLTPLIADLRTIGNKPSPHQPKQSREHTSFTGARKLSLIPGVGIWHAAASMSSLGVPSELFVPSTKSTICDESTSPIGNRVCCSRESSDGQ